jgi:hypothetical protein
MSIRHPHQHLAISKTWTLSTDLSTPLPAAPLMAYQLNLTIVAAQGLRAADSNGFSDPYCKVEIMHYLVPGIHVDATGLVESIMYGLESRSKLSTFNRIRYDPLRTQILMIGVGSLINRSRTHAGED